jgi:antibiotic biosynthesis monooxygenase (ABM) superfamily enzyme
MKEATAVATKPVAVVVKLRLREGVDQAFSAWHARMCTVTSQLPGFISAEVNAPSAAGPPVWRIAQRFRTEDTLRSWLESEQYRQLILEAESFVDENQAGGLIEERGAENSDEATVTEVVTTLVRSDRAGEYKEWAAKIHRAEAQFPGYRGGFLQPPASPDQGYWTTLVRFGSPEQLDAWLNSREREELLREHRALVSSWSQHRLPTSFAGWFPQDEASSGSPAKWKQSMVVIMMLFPIVMLELRFLTPLTGGLKPALGTFIGNVLSVFLLAWPFMPIAIRGLKWWLVPAEDRPSWTHLCGTVLVLAIYALEIAFFWRWLT